MVNLHSVRQIVYWTEMGVGAAGGIGAQEQRLMAVETAWCDAGSEGQCYATPMRCRRWPMSLQSKAAGFSAQSLQPASKAAGLLLSHKIGDQTGCKGSASIPVIASHGPACPLVPRPAPCDRNCVDNQL
jgi:hypothetical protein